MPGADDIRDAIVENATGPRKHTEAEGMSSTEQHSLPDQIAALKHIASRDGAAGAKLPIRRAPLTSPGAGEY